MKWLVVVSCVVCLVHLSEAGVLATKSKPDSTVKLIEDSDDGVLKKGRDCEPGTKWMNRCNSCFCTEQGLVSCTKNDCPGMESVEEVLCAEDSEWKKDCNSCWCLGGIAQCTKMACGVIEYVDIDAYLANKSKTTTEKIPAAKPEVKTENSLSNTKTKAVTAAIEYINEEKAGLPKTSTEIPQTTELFSERSSTTTALKEQSSQQPLSKGGNTEDRIVFNEKSAVKNATKKVVCVANRMFIKDCNTCWCNEDGTRFYCTRRVCIPELSETGIDEEFQHDLRILKKECRPDEVFEMDCNTCRCNSDGKSFSCTRRACMEEEEGKDRADYRAKKGTLMRSKRQAQEPPKTCLPGQEFRMDCNKCLCNNEGRYFSCTRNDCSKPNGNGNGGVRRKRAVNSFTDVTEQVKVECAPGSVFDRGCNVCSCSLSGHEATCTSRPCPVPNNQDNDINSPIPDADENFRCNPGEQTKRDCNDCTCSADGKSTFCTLRLCDVDVTGGL